MAMTKKYRNFGLLFRGARAEERAAELCIQRRRRTRARKKQVHRSFFGPPIFPKIGVISVFIVYSSKKVKE